MIDLSHWRARIGLWNCCQAASGRPAKASQYSCRSIEPKKEKMRRLSKMLLLCVLIIFFAAFLMNQLLYNLSLSKGVNEVNVQQSTTLYLEIYTESNQNVCYHLIVFLLLLLAGDIELNPGPCATDILKRKSAKLIAAMSANIVKIADELYAKELIPQQAKNEMHVTAEPYTKASKLIAAVEGQLEGLGGLEDSLRSRQYLITFCEVLINQHSRSLEDLAKSMLQNLGTHVCYAYIVTTPLQWFSYTQAWSDQIN
ncbi:PREDICTED: uncharacterized protein LOC109588826 [Amphimedon queenslandica]|uniref:Uncharacterized protein n=2 Tax=Amphimedon queenslandica TaxID=400682 RepID=A0AAN0JUD6_AMPQE|nr:PREDICTED: uncharacterized protein LOC109588826 [Amphimedon queenslandica]|eukprot:XP_019860502.1 PREDICTED: uncharacterized protein LOC109588826 [Amphimedon queenslandica]